MKCFEFNMLYSSYFEANLSVHSSLGAPSFCLSFTAGHTYLSSCVYDLRCKLLAILDPDELAECVLDGWVIALDKVTIDESDREG